VKRYRTPLDLQGLEFVEVWKQFFIVRVGEALGHEGGIADGPLRGPTGIATAQPGIWIRLEQDPILALPHLRVQLHNLPAQPLAREESKIRSKKIRHLPLERCRVRSLACLEWEKLHLNQRTGYTVTRKATAAYKTVFDVKNGDLRQKMPSFGTYVVEYQLVARVRPGEGRRREGYGRSLVRVGLISEICHRSTELVLQPLYPF
jgi:hypothetical protein